MLSILTTILFYHLCYLFQVYFSIDFTLSHQCISCCLSTGFKWIKIKGNEMKNFSSCWQKLPYLYWKLIKRWQNVLPETHQSSLSINHHRSHHRRHHHHHQVHLLNEDCHLRMSHPMLMLRSHMASAALMTTPFKHKTVTGWLRCTVVERRSLTSKLSLSHARPVADGWPLIWVNHPL